MNLIRIFKNWMYSAPEENRYAVAIILWWEARRIPYNLIVGMTGSISLPLFYSSSREQTHLNLGKMKLSQLPYLRHQSR